MMAKDNRNEEVARSIMYTLELVNSRKPNDGTPTDVVYAITQTDLQKVYAYFVVSIRSADMYEEGMKLKANQKEN
jgi:hypothetical protein